MERIRILARAACVTLLALAAATNLSFAQEKKPIVIGGTLGLTGSLSEASKDYKAVYDRWLEQVNKKGGLLGRQVKMIIYNDESTPTVAQSLYNRLLDQDGADLVLAPYTTFVGGAIVPIVQSHKKMLFNGGFVGLKLFKNGDGWIVGTYTYQEPDYTRGVFELIKTLPQDQRPKRIAIFTLQNPFTLVVRDGFEGTGGALNFAKEVGIPVVVSEQYPPNTTDFNPLVQKAKAANADLVLQLGLVNDTLQVARTIQQQGYKPAMFCTCGSMVTTVAAWPKLGTAAEGAFGTTPSWPSQKFAGLDDLAAYFKEQGQSTVPTYAIVALSILQVIEQAVEGAKTLDQAKLKEYIHSHEFHTAAGNIKYQADGTPVYSQIILQFQNGKNEVVWPEKYRTAAPVIPAVR
ncbi:MAG: amino acid ABC transporter substrate-binding protein [Burkholderiales bacterium]|nr:amino acid ABC transporter substrate-binding protein [Burkholderiales bacterium]